MLEPGKTQLAKGISTLIFRALFHKESLGIILKKLEYTYNKPSRKSMAFFIFCSDLVLLDRINTYVQKSNKVADKEIKQ